MNIDFISSIGNAISFGYSSILKDLFKEGELPTVKKGLYGAKIDKNNVSLEHMIPHSKGGPSKLSNYALADRFMNSQRGNDDIRKYLKPETAKEYFEQFKDVIVKHKNRVFNGNNYIKEGIKTLDKLGVHIDMKG